MLSYYTAWLQLPFRLFSSNTNQSETPAYLKQGVIHYHVRRNVAKQIFESDYDKLGRFIQVSYKEYDELFEIEGSKLEPNKKRDGELVAKLKQILNKEVNHG